MSKRLPEKGTPEWHKIQIAKKTLAINPAMATALGGMTIEEAKKVIEEYGIKIKMDRGGTVVGESHKNGGVPFVLSDTGTAIEEEGKEINIPRELAESDEIYEFEGTNWEILNKILKLGGLSLKSEVTEVKSGDIVICIKSAWDDTPRKYKGTIRQILSAINESRGCNHIESGATMKNLETGEQKKMGKGGVAVTATCKTCRWWNEGRPTNNMVAECDFIKTITGEKFEKTKKAFYVTADASDDTGLHYELMTGEEFGCIHHSERSDKKSKGGDIASGISAQKISKEKAKELFDKGVVVYVKTEPHGEVDTSDNAFGLRKDLKNVGGSNMYMYGQTQEEYGFDNMLKWFKERSEYPDFDFEFYTLNENRLWFLEKGKTLANGGEAGDLTDSEKRVLTSIHLRGMTGSMGSMNLAQRRKLLEGLIEKGYLDKNANVTKKGVDAIRLSRGGDTANKTSGISWIITGTSI